MPTEAKRIRFSPKEPFVSGEKLSEVLRKIDYETLLSNKLWYASCERARQHWYGTGAGSQDALRFYTAGKLGADAYKRSYDLYSTVMSDSEVSEAFQKAQPDKYRVFANRFLGLNALVECYAYIKNDSWDATKKRMTVGEYLDKKLNTLLGDDSDEKKFVKGVTTAVKKASGDVSGILKTLEEAIKKLATRIGKYLNDVYNRGVTEVFCDYAQAYKALEKTPESGNKLSSSMSATAEFGTAKDKEERKKLDHEGERYRHAELVLGALAGIATDAGDDRKKGLCLRLKNDIPD